MYLVTHIQNVFGDRVVGSIKKSHMDYDNFEELAEILEEFQPDLIGIRTLSYFKDFFHETVDHIRALGWTVPIILGGPHATSNHKDCLANTNLDLVVWAEGESTLEDLCQKMMDNDNRWPSEDVLATIPGVVYRNSETFSDADRTMGIDLSAIDSLPITQFDDNEQEPESIAFPMATDLLALDIPSPAPQRKLVSSALNNSPSTASTDAESSANARRVLEKIWLDILELDEVAGSDDFIEMGGDSLMVALLGEEISQRIGRTVKIEDLLANLELDSMHSLVTTVGV
jgi:hypothetical protein